MVLERTGKSFAECAGCGSIKKVPVVIDYIKITTWKKAYLQIVSWKLSGPSDDRNALIIELNGEPEVEAARQMTRVPDVGHEDIGGVLLEDIGALGAEGLVSRHLAVAGGDACEG